MVPLRCRLGSYLVQVSAIRLVMVQIGLVWVQIVCGLTLLVRSRLLYCIELAQLCVV